MDDIDDLKKEYGKVKDGLNDEQRTKLESTFEEAEAKKKGEFFTIGKCRKEFANSVEGGASPFANPVGGARAAPAPAAAPEPQPQPPAPEGVERFALTDLMTKLDAAVEAGLTPLILDKSPDHKVDTFFNYGKGSLMLDCKVGGCEFMVVLGPCQLGVLLGF